MLNILTRAAMRLLPIADEFNKTQERVKELEGEVQNLQTMLANAESSVQYEEVANSMPVRMTAQDYLIKRFGVRPQRSFITSFSQRIRYMRKQQGLDKKFGAPTLCPNNPQKMIYTEAMLESCYRGWKFDK
ncbi:hypothetical protein [Methyloversatilis sp.]|uniref:hypothetical protein n=1 Tax=Methyloversatilis sp. TaxID=2569862 RepID=UPI0035B3FAA0